MKKKIKILVLILLTTTGQTLWGQAINGANIQQSVKIEIPEIYELSNIILALTDYGISDKWEVQKNTEYYKNVLEYFSPFKDHILLDSVNYSREKWDYYLAFRTDGIAYSFDENNKLIKNFEYATQPGLNPFGENISLINDFVEKSNFRAFFANNQPFYQRLINNYKAYNFVNEMTEFLDNRIGKSKEQSQLNQYRIILSPLVYRMNCHRQISKNVVADFPSALSAFINGSSNNEDVEERLNSNHLLFTEKDHEYINPITDRNIELVSSSFNTKYWDNKSGYEGVNSFNEYMTWAIYDIFLEEKFPEYAKKLSTFWQYQNASRGFFAQNIFSDKVKELYKQNGGKKFEDIYVPLLKWTKEIEQEISLPRLVNIDKKSFVEIEPNNIQLDCSESMNTQLPFEVRIIEYKNGQQTGKNKVVEITEFKWTNNNKTLNFGITTDYEEFDIVFNWWGIEKPLFSDKGIYLEPSSSIRLKKK